MGARWRTAAGQVVTPLCRVADIPDGRARGFLPDTRRRDRVLAIRQGARVYVYVNNCPHYDRAPLGWKKDEFLNKDGTHVLCAAHGALFRVEDGICEIGPCLGQGLTKIASQVEDGTVLIDASALATPQSERPGHDPVRHL